MSFGAVKRQRSGLACCWSDGRLTPADGCTGSSTLKIAPLLLYFFFFFFFSSRPPGLSIENPPLLIRTPDLGVFLFLICSSNFNVSMLSKIDFCFVRYMFFIFPRFVFLRHLVQQQMFIDYARQLYFTEPKVLIDCYFIYCCDYIMFIFRCFVYLIPVCQDIFNERDEGQKKRLTYRSRHEQLFPTRACW